MLHGRLVRTLAALVLAATVALAGCADGTGATALPGDAPATMRLTLNVSGTPIATLVVKVSGAGITPPLLFNLAVVNGFASGTLAIPPGTARQIDITALDSAGHVTHSGSRTVDLVSGTNPPLTLALSPVPGLLPVTVTFGSVSITIAPAQLIMTAGATQPLTASITDANGSAVAGPPLWATSDPSIVAVDAKGVVSAIRAGDVDVVATYAGVAGVAHVHVGAGNNGGAPLRAVLGPDVEASFGEGLTLAPTSSGGSGAPVTFTWRVLGAGISATAPSGTSFTAPTGTVGTVWLEATPVQQGASGIADTVLVHVVVDRTKAVWISPGASGVGTRADPMGSLAQAASKATQLGGAVYAAWGTYPTSGLAVSASLYAGYNPTTWARVTTTQLDTMQSSSPTALRVITDGVTIEGWAIVAARGVAPGGSSTGVQVVANNVTLLNNAIRAGAGAAGADASPGSSPSRGANGFNGLSGASGAQVIAAGGAGGLSTGNPARGGAGGGGGYGSTGATGLSGLPTAPATAALGGAGGAPSSGCFVRGGTGAAGQNGASGVDGADGAPLASASLNSRFGASGFRTISGNGGNAGSNGSGGGGGGGGGGSSTTLFCQGDTGGGGGGGGAGGTGGDGGAPGGGGGGSFGIVVVQGRSVTISGNTIFVSTGGTGGAGAAGGAGSLGGVGGAGGAPADDAGGGGNGGAGGRGGNGGGSSGGAGGPSVGIVLAGAIAPTTTLNTIVLGAAGAGGVNANGTQRSVSGTSAATITVAP